MYNYTQENLKVALAIIEKAGLEARWILGTRPDNWTDEHVQAFAINWGTPKEPMPVLALHVKAEPSLHNGLRSISQVLESGVDCVYERYNGSGYTPGHDVTFSYDDLVMLQVRGLKRNGEPKF